MKAAHISKLNGPDAVEIVDVEAPEPNAGQVLIEVHAAGVSFPEVLQTRGRYQVKPDLPFIPGAEVGGVVIQAPPSSGLVPGDRVAALSFLGGFAEYTVADAETTFKIPDSMSFEQAAAVPFNYLTAHFALLPRGRLTEGESVLIHGAAGGIGTASIQTAKAFGAGQIIAVTSTDEKGRTAIDAGADEYVLADRFKDPVKKHTKGRGVDIVVDPVGGDRFTDSLRSLTTNGRLLVIGFTAGSIPEVKVNRLLLNNIDVIGVGWGAYARPRPGYLHWQWSEIEPHITSGTITAPIGGSYPLDDAISALKAIDDRQATGKLVLKIR